MNTRTETDSLGAIEVPVDRYYGAQTEEGIQCAAGCKGGK